MITRVPGWARALLRWVGRRGAADDVVGDLEEAHVRRLGRHGRFVASVLTGVEAVELAAALLRERMRIGPGSSWLDVKLGVRMLFKYPGLTVVGSLALAVAIGLSAAYFEFVNDFSRPRLPLPEGDRVVGIQSWGMVPSRARYSSLEDFVRWRDGLRSVEELSAFARVRSNLITEDGRAEAVDGVEMTAKAFRLAGSAPLLGRTLIAADEQPGAAAVVVIGHRRWQSMFGGDPGIIGRAVKLGSTPATVVGVMPEGFAFPEDHDVWVPLRADLSEALRRPGPTVKVFGRLAAGVTRERAQAELVAIDAHVPAGADSGGGRVSPRIIPYVALFLAGDSDAGVLYVLHALFPLLLAVVCVNMATLVFARTAARTGEIAIRTALGASRRRIVFQLFAEALVLSAVSAAIGLAAATLGLRAAMRWARTTGETVPFWMDERVASGTLLYVAALTVFAGAIMGVIPALKATGRSVQNRLRELGAGGAGLRFGGLWTCVIVFQVALTVGLLPIAVTSVWKAVRFESAPLGLAGERYLVGFLPPGDRGSAVDPVGPAQRESRVRASYEEIERRLAAEPGVGGVTFARALPGMEHVRRRIEVEDAAAYASIVPHEVSATWIAADYFDDLESPVLAGRAFGAGDLAAGRAVVVNESFVRHVLRGRNALGRRIRYVDEAGGEPGEWHEVVGVAADLGMTPEDPAHAAGIYHPLPPGGPAWLAVRLQGAAAQFAPRLRAILAGMDPALQVDDLQTLADAARRRRTGSWFRAALAGLVSAITLVLSAAGIFSLMSFTVTRRTREIGIRSVLGATPRRIVFETFSRAAVQLGIGLAAGSALAVLPGYPGERVASVLAIAAFVALIGLLACGIPVRRALRIEPTEAVRET